MAGFEAKFLERVGKPLREGVSLAALSSFRIGGPADFFFEADTTDDLRAALSAAREAGVRRFVMGGGTNLLFDDAGFRGLIVKAAFRGLDFESTGAGGLVVRAAAGERLDAFLEGAVARGAGGVEFLAGIPGTVGGAVFGNAGAYGKAVGDLLDTALLLAEDGAERRVGREHFAFAYRHSGLKARHEILLEAVFRLRSGDPVAVRAQISEYLAARGGKHPPWGTACAGSYFKNPSRPDGTKVAAGFLLDRAGARGTRVGGAAVSARHCNFLVNDGGATAGDVRALAAELKARVLAASGIALEEEVIFLPADAPSL